MSDPLQTLITARLNAIPEITAFIGNRIYSRATAGAAMPYVSYGESNSVPEDAEGINSDKETLQIDIWSEASGQGEAKNLVKLISRALKNYDNSLNTDIGSNALASMWVDSQRVIPDPDGVTTHGVVTVSASIEYD